MLRNQLAQVLLLDGEWEFSLSQPGVYTPIQVPGAWEAQGYPKTIDGPAFYRKDVRIPTEWSGKRIFLEFEAVSYACKIYWNGREVGQHTGIWTPFALDVTSHVVSGQENRIEIEVYKPGEKYPMRTTLAGFIPDVATTFGGLWGSVRLRACCAGIQGLYLDPNSETGEVKVTCRSKLYASPTSDISWELVISSGGMKKTSLTCANGSGERLETSLTVPDFQLWAPEHPNLYQLEVRLSQGSEMLAVTSQRFGFRKLNTKGGQLSFNGEPIFLRGVLSWGWDADRIAPCYDPEGVRQELQRVKLLGFNMVKLCLFIPNQVYFDIADEEGIFLWQEWPMWLPQVTPELRLHAPSEYAEWMSLTRHHPSVILYSLGCELSQNVDPDLLGMLNDQVRSRAKDVLCCDNSGSGESYGGLDFDYSDFTDYHPYYDLEYFEPLLDNWRRDWQVERPWIFGEFCDSDGFRDLDEIIVANGGKKPWWLTEDNPVTSWRPEARALLEIQERLASAKLGFSNQELVRMANAQSRMVRKYTLEALRRRKNIGGYVLTGLRDTPIATSGMFDDFDRPKWSEEEFLPFNGEKILCLDTSRRRRWHHGGDRPDRLDIHNWWAGELAHWHLIASLSGEPVPTGSKLTWRLADLRGNTLHQGENSIPAHLPSGYPVELAALECRLPSVNQAQELSLQAEMTGPGWIVRNQWPMWVYPPISSWPANLGLLDPGHLLDDWDELIQVTQQHTSTSDIPPGSTIISTTWNSGLHDFLRSGGRMLLIQQGNGPLPSRRGPFWREAVKLLLDHPIWRVFPHQGFIDLQFFGMATDVMLHADQAGEAIQGLTEIKPIIRRLDAREFHVSDYLFEGRLGEGRLMSCSLRFQGGTGSQPSGLRRNVAGLYLLWSLLQYLSTS